MVMMRCWICGSAAASTSSGRRHGQLGGVGIYLAGPCASCPPFQQLATLSLLPACCPACMRRAVCGPRADLLGAQAWPLLLPCRRPVMRRWLRSGAAEQAVGSVVTPMPGRVVKVPRAPPAT